MAPEGWHIPTEKEWNILIKYLGDFSGMKMKSATDWDSDNVHNVDGNGTNASGFSALPSGCRYEDSTSNYKGFNGDGEECDFWSSKTVDRLHGLSYALYSYMREIHFGPIYKGAGFSVRCVKN